MIAAQEIVERALTAAAHLHGCVVLVQSSSEAVLRWANSTMTTNGHTTSGRVTVIALANVDGGGFAAGVVSSSVTITDPAQLADLVRAAEASARDAGPAEDAMPLSLLVPAFLLSEIKRGFEVGFLIFLPFLVIDLVIAAVLMSMGMMMVPPAIVSLP
ncbi:MAG: flagellar type III secretion system pore protein FliP, partial [Pseudonocardia sp.]|nr:flagellar type III secretion system pore protein FliP [Pseudonocardia sp.]